MQFRIPLPGDHHLQGEVQVPPGGDGRPWVVFLHGLGSSRGGEKASFLEEHLTRRGHAFARFDFRGHGDSSGRFAGLTLSRQIEDLRAVLDHLRRGSVGAPMRRAVLIGSSMGAVTAAWHAALHPGPIVGQILIAPAFRLLERILESLGDEGRQQWRQQGTRRFLGPWFDFELDYDVVRDARRYPLHVLFEKTSVPTLVVHGTRDASAPIEWSREFAAACRATRPHLHAVPDGDHRLTEHKELLLEEVTRFLDQWAGDEGRPRAAPA